MAGIYSDCSTRGINKLSALAIKSNRFTRVCLSIVERLSGMVDELVFESGVSAQCFVSHAGNMIVFSSS